MENYKVGDVILNGNYTILEKRLTAARLMSTRLIIRVGISMSL